MGSGKSFECVRSVIIPAIKTGRRVVTNVDGIDSDAIRAYCVDVYGKSLGDLGHVVHCSNEDVQSPLFLPHGTADVTFCNSGDLICIDEAWRFWGVGCALLEQHKIFFREHRHYVDPKTKVSCDLVLMVQDIGDLHRTLKVVVELSFRTTKLKSLGRNDAYRVEMWEGYKQPIKSRAGLEIKKYDPAIFPLYSSYSGGHGKEMQIDGRQNQITAAKIAIACIALVVLCIGLFFSYRFFTPEGHGITHKPVVPSQQPDSSKASTSSLPKSESNAPAAAGTTRVAGFLFLDKDRYVILETGGSLQFEHPSGFMNIDSIYTVTGSLNGQTVRGVK